MASTDSYWRSRLAAAGLQLDDAAAEAIQRSVIARFRLEAANICQRRLHTPLLTEGEPDFFPVTPRRLELALPKVAFGLLAAYLEAVQAAIEDNRGVSNVDGKPIVAVLTPGTPIERDGAAADLHEALTAFDWTDVDLEDADVVFADEVARALTERFGEISYRLAVEPEPREAQLLRDTATKAVLDSRWLDQVLTVGGAMQAVIERVEGTPAGKREVNKLRRLAAQRLKTKKKPGEGQGRGALKAVFEGLERTMARARGLEPEDEAEDTAPPPPPQPEIVPLGPPPSQNAEVDELIVNLLRVKRAKGKTKPTATKPKPATAPPDPDKAALQSFLGRLLGDETADDDPEPPDD